METEKKNKSLRARAWALEPGEQMEVIYADPKLKTLKNYACSFKSIDGRRLLVVPDRDIKITIVRVA